MAIENNTSGRLSNIKLNNKTYSLHDPDSYHARSGVHDETQLRGAKRDPANRHYIWDETSGETSFMQQDYSLVPVQSVNDPYNTLTFIDSYMDFTFKAPRIDARADATSTERVFFGVQVKNRKKMSKWRFLTSIPRFNEEDNAVPYMGSYDQSVYSGADFSCNTTNGLQYIVEGPTVGQFLANYVLPLISSTPELDNELFRAMLYGTRKTPRDDDGETKLITPCCARATASNNQNCFAIEFPGTMQYTNGIHTALDFPSVGYSLPIRVGFFRLTFDFEIIPYTEPAEFLLTFGKKRRMYNGSDALQRVYKYGIKKQTYRKR